VAQQVLYTCVGWFDTTTSDKPTELLLADMALASAFQPVAELVLVGSFCELRTVSCMSNENQDPITAPSTQDFEGDTTATGSESIPSSHNLGILHENHITVKPSIASIANAGVTSARKQAKKVNNARISTQSSSTSHNVNTSTGNISSPLGVYTPSTLNNTSGSSANNPPSQRSNSQSKQYNAMGSGATQPPPPLNFPNITGDNVKDWHHILITIGKVRGEAVVKLANFIISRKYAENPLRATALSADLLENASEEYCENISTLVSDGWDQSIGALFSCARKL
jgi:hypothetical protein